MTDLSRIKPSHTQRAAYVYIRQSTPGQVEHNRESTARQYALADKACQLGWPREQVVIVDEDLGLSGSSTDKRSGFVRLTSEVALAHVGIVLGLEVSRLARNNADGYRLLELCGVTGNTQSLTTPAAKSSAEQCPRSKRRTQRQVSHRCQSSSSLSMPESSFIGATPPNSMSTPPRSNSTTSNAPISTLISAPGAAVLRWRVARRSRTHGPRRRHGRG